MDQKDFTIRSATPADVATVVRLINDLALYEKQPEDCHADPALLHEHLFGSRRYAEVLIAERGPEPVGFALFFHNYSTWLTKPGLYLEALCVVAEAGGLGIGKALLVRLAQIAVERGCGRMEWSVLTWNEPAIGFYVKLGAVPMTGWQVYRLTGDALARLGSD